MPHRLMPLHRSASFRRESGVGLRSVSRVGDPLAMRESLPQNPVMANFDDVWTRIERHAGQTFATATGLPFTYRVPGDYLKVSRDGREINRSLSRTNFQKASVSMPVAKPSDIK